MLYNKMFDYNQNVKKDKALQKKNNNLSLLNKKELSLCAKTICNNHEKTFYNFQLLTFLFWRHVTGEKQHASVS